jgi:tetratricopeptide (TPR) repeat protein
VGLAVKNGGKNMSMSVNRSSGVSLRMASMQTGGMAITYNKTGLSLMKAGKYEAAAKQFMKVLDINPNDDVAHDNLGSALRGMGKTKEAIEEFEKAKSINPENETTHNNLGTAFYDQGRFADAAVEFNEALRINPKNDFARINLGITYSDMGRTDDAIKELEKAPNSTDAHTHLGNIYYKRGMMKEAKREFKQALKLDPKNDIARDNLKAIKEKDN